ncbi:protein of unknown function [Trichlorobacter ammonificans]|uniref:Uncharacterized protein n=1 Tax=Trichlorobacter ammonificans TaxID=2916410 RepID=A0ABN8HKT6_9BACT|nr:protein of unknown function [Trichlorobacter ammonificans]
MLGQNFQNYQKLLKYTLKQLTVSSTILEILWHMETFILQEIQSKKLSFCQN